jgi:FkbM family methyltransferase
MTAGLNAIAEHSSFKQSTLSRSFREIPLSFIDIGAAGGAHELVLPVASLTHCTCFEPDEDAYHDLMRRLAEFNPFSRTTVLQMAVSRNRGKANLNLTQSSVNSSLLKPRGELISRYNKSGFHVKQTVPVKTQSLDALLFQNDDDGTARGELIKMDCQGAEYLILQGAARTLRHCMALLCEVMFFPMYEEQKTFSDIDLFLRNKGFQLYGLYPNYISAQKLDRTKYDSEERVVWADAVYFRDPFSEDGNAQKWDVRQVEALLLATLLFHFYDFSLEIIDFFYKEHRSDTTHLRDLVLSLAAERKASLEKETIAFSQNINRMPAKTFLLAKKFIDRNKSNSNLDNIKV